MRKMRYVCQVCGYVYDDAKEKIPFSELPENWRCPLCGAAKSDFKPETLAQSSERKPTAIAVKESTDELQPLNAGQFSALCANLARGCEKQYLPQEAGWFTELAEAFHAHATASADASVEALSTALLKDIEQYTALRAIADANGDRGAARVCVWGEKVTRMLSSLMERYRREGDAMLEDQFVWVCSVCGFVWIGKEAPPLCPVCKVPAWKFEKMEGKA